MRSTQIDFKSKKGYNFSMLKSWLLALGVIVVAMPVLLLASQAQAAEGDTYIREISYTLEQPFAGISTITSFSQYLQLVYGFALGVIGMIAVVLIMFGGLRWLGAAGNEQAITEAKEIIISALTGLVIALLSYMILIFINPQTLKQSFSVTLIDPLGEDPWFDYTSCNDVAFGTNTCTVEGKEQVCNTIACGTLGFKDGGWCRGQTCSEGSEKCYPQALTPTTGEACVQVQCGEYIQNCKDKNYKSYQYLVTTDEEGMRYCMCDYYNSLGHTLNTYPDSSVPDELADNISDYTSLCTEAATQETWVERLSDPANEYGYTGSASTNQWNCYFSCNINSTLSWGPDNYYAGMPPASIVFQHCVP